MTITRATKKTLAAGAVLAGLGGSAYGAPLSLSETFDSPSGGGEFGSSVALDGGQVLVGDPFVSTSGIIFAGQAQLFDAATGNLLRTFDDPVPTLNDRFGASVALQDGQVLVGDPEDNTNGSNVGQAHLFNAATGALLQTFDDPTPNSGTVAGGRFGFSVALDSDQVLIGERIDDSNGSAVGQAHLFDAATGSLLQTLDDPTPTTSDNFGYSVALDGGQALVGAPFDDTNSNNGGQAHLFTAATTTTPIPVPSTIALLGAGLFGAGLLGSAGAARRRRAGAPVAS